MLTEHHENKIHVSQKPVFLSVCLCVKLVLWRRKGERNAITVRPDVPGSQTDEQTAWLSTTAASQAASTKLSRLGSRPPRPGMVMQCDSAPKDTMKGTNWVWGET